MWYEIQLDTDDNDTLVVTAPLFPEVTTFGDNPAEACLHARGAIEEAIAARIAHGEDIPLPMKDAEGKDYVIEVPAMIFLKSALYTICRFKKISRAELCRRLDWKREQVDRLFRLDHNSRLDQLEAAFKAVKVPLSFDIPMPVAA